MQYSFHCNEQQPVDQLFKVLKDTSKLAFNFQTFISFFETSVLVICAFQF